MYDLDITGWMTETELKHIEMIAQRVPEHGNVLEIGSFLGRSAWAWAKSIPATAKLHCVDIWSDYIVDNNTYFGIKPKELRNSLKMFLENMKDCQNMIYTKSVSLIISSFPNDYYDVVFIDGDHSNPNFKLDLDFSYPLVKSGGMLCGHDYGTRFKDITTEVDILSEVLNIPIKRQSNSTIWEIEV